MKVHIFLPCLLLLLLASPMAAQEEDIHKPHPSAADIKKEVEDHNNPASEIIQEISDAANNKTFEIETEIRSSLKRAEKIIDMTFGSIDEMTLRNSWREGLAVDKDLQFEADLTFYKIKAVYDYPCKSINFLFGIRSDLEVFTFNARRYLLCFLKFFDQEIKEYLSDLVVTGAINVLKSGHANPISTFFTNLIIIEGPLRLKEELWGALYKYVEENAELNRSFESLIKNLINLCFNREQFAVELAHFQRYHSTSLLFFFYDMVIMFLEDKEIYLSAYDFIQPDSSLISNPESMDPQYVTNKYSEILLQDLNRFKEIQKSYQTNPASTVYHRTYAKYVDKNIKLLCRIIYRTEDC